MAQRVNVRKYSLSSNTLAIITLTKRETNSHKCRGSRNLSDGTPIPMGVAKYERKNFAAQFIHTNSRALIQLRALPALEQSFGANTASYRIKRNCSLKFVTNTSNYVNHTLTASGTIPLGLIQSGLELSGSIKSGSGGLGNILIICSNADVATPCTYFDGGGL